MDSLDFVLIGSSQAITLFVGGCELSFMKEFLEANGAQCYHTFDHSEPSNQFLAFSDDKDGIYQFN
ncbi:MAG: hypothetical protein ACFFCX_16090, partial [Candidatus Sifarchaeia archaeon]